MKKFNKQNAYLLVALLLTVFMAGCSSGGGDGTTTATTNTTSATSGTSGTDTTAPTVTLTVPADVATGVALNSKVTATFSEDMTATTISGTTFTLTGPGGAVVAGGVTYVAAVKTATFVPTANLASGTMYTATITTGATDLAGNPLALAKAWTFTTGTTADSVPPTVLSTDPAANVTGVLTTQRVSATFSEAMDPATIIAANFTLVDGLNPPVAGTMDYVGTTAIFTPSASLTTNTTYTATIAGVVQDLAGNQLGNATTWSFTTAATVATGPQAPVLGETARFLILASQTITTTGSAASALSGGDLGILDQARSYYAGFTVGATPGSFAELTNGISFAPDDVTPPYTIPAPYASTVAFINQVRTDLGIAYNFLAADPNPGAATQVCPTQLGGLILTRGVYKTAADVLITTGPLHLDAQGDPNAVFIFSIDGTLTVGAPSGAIILDNGALARNVYFRTAGATSIEANISFYGNVFAKSQINVLADARITGRLYAVDDQVTLISDAVTAP